MSTIFVTGFPGFLASALVLPLLRARPRASALCLVQPRYADLAGNRVEELVARDPDAGRRIRLAEGDITLPGLGLASPGQAAREVGDLFHLAAVYDLSVSRQTGMRVNVGGTRHVLDFCERAPGLRRLHYVSTCYVSGRHPGTFRETDLDVGQSFNNHYEETKFLAEVAVQDRMAGGLPATVYRPSIVVGDSHTGATQKYDGPYVFIQLLLRQGRTALLPVVGRPEEVELNVVPRDFVIPALAHLSGDAGRAGTVYHLADDSPPTLDAAIRAVGDAAGKRVVRVPLPLGLARAALRHVPGVERLVGIPPEALDYFVHPTSYDTTHATRDLSGSGLAPPSFLEYVDAVVRFMEAHPEVGRGAMA